MEKGAQSAPGAPLPLAFNLLALSTCDVTVCGASPVPSCLSSPDRCRGGQVQGLSAPVAPQICALSGHPSPGYRRARRGAGGCERALPRACTGPRRRRWPAAPAQGRWVGGGVDLVNLLAAGVKAVLFPSLGMGGASGFFP